MKSTPTVRYNGFMAMMPLKDQNMTENNPQTDTDDLPRVVIRRSWVVHTYFKDDEDDYRVDDEEFDNKAEAMLHAAQQADKHGVGITYGHECN